MTLKCLRRRRLKSLVFITVLFFLFGLCAFISLQNAGQRTENDQNVILVRQLTDSVDVYEPIWTYGYTSTLCKNDTDPFMAEDIFCTKRPKLLENYKNPCFMKKDGNGRERVSCMPYFHLLGADKCGTTDLHDRIIRHPDLEVPVCAGSKECSFWCWTRYGIWLKNATLSPKRKTYEAYLGLYNGASKNIAIQEENGYHYHITGEGTPMDLWDFRGWTRIPQNRNLKEPRILTPHLMRHVYHYPRFLILLRNPIDRLYSDYYFMGEGILSPERFHEDTLKAISMIENCTTHRSLRSCLYGSEMYSNLPLRLHISCYSVFIKEWFKVFPRETFLVLRSEDYGRDIKTHVQAVFDFLELRKLPGETMDILSNPNRKHQTEKKKSKGPMLESTFTLLEKFFSPYNEELAELLNDERYLWKDEI